MILYAGFNTAMDQWPRWQNTLKWRCNEHAVVYHIPKTVGMSTWQLIEWLYPEDKICPGRMWEDIIRVPMDVMNNYDAFRGHFLAYLEPYLGRALSTFTVLT